MIKKLKNILEYNEFADWLNPMLVKELHQRLRKKLFIISFIIFQIGMFFIYLMQMIGRTSNSSTNIFLFLITLILIIISLQGHNAISSEKRNKKLQLITLSEMTPLKIVLGIWSSIVSMLILVSLSSLPYIIISYFISSSNLTSDLIILLINLLITILITAIFISISTYNAFFKIIIIFGLFFSPYLFGLIINLIFSSLKYNYFNLSRLYNFESYNTLENIFFIIWSIIAYVVILSLSLLNSAKNIKPYSTNYTFYIRLITLLFSLISLLNIYINNNNTRSQFILIITLIPSIITIIISLTEKPYFSTEFYKPFTSKLIKPFNKISIIFAQGWHTGILFTIIQTLILFSGILLIMHKSHQKIMIFTQFTNYMITLNIFLLPLLIALIYIKKSEKSIFLTYLTINIILLAIIFSLIPLSLVSNLFIYLLLPIPFFSIIISNLLPSILNYKINNFYPLKNFQEFLQNNSLLYIIFETTLIAFSATVTTILIIKAKPYFLETKNYFKKNISKKQNEEIP